MPKQPNKKQSNENATQIKTMLFAWEHTTLFTCLFPFYIVKSASQILIE